MVQTFPLERWEGISKGAEMPSLSECPLVHRVMCPSGDPACGGVGLKLMEGTRGLHLYLCRAQSWVALVLCAVNFRQSLVPAGFFFQPGGAAALLKHKGQKATRSGPAWPCTSSVLRRPLCRQRHSLCSVITHSAKFQGLLPTLPPIMMTWAKFSRNNKIMQDKAV